MIYVLTGKNGASKTYNASRILYRYWRQGIDVYTNSPMFFLPKKHIEQYGWEIPINLNPEEHPKYFSFLEKIKYKLLKNRDFEKTFWRLFILPGRGKIKYFEELEETYMITDAVIFYDEGQELFDAQYWERLPMFFKRKLRQHRKDFLDIITTTQEIGQIDKNYRRLIQVWYNYERKFKIGIDPKILVGWFVRQEMDCTQLKGTADIIEVPILGTKNFLIGFLSRRLYDPMFKINYRFFRIIWIEIIKAKKKQMIAITCPKEMSTKTALQTISYMKSPSISKILAS